MIKNITLLAFIFCTAIACKNGTKKTGVTIEDTDNMYRFETQFDPAKTRKIEKLINNRIAPTNFELDDDVDVTAVLPDRTRFHFESSPGELEIRFDKNENSRDSYQRIKALCADIRAVIDGKDVR